jgi:hypothetical protein
LVIEAHFPPLGFRSDAAFGDVAGRLDAVVLEECEQMIPIIEQPSIRSSYIGIAGQFKGLKENAHWWS